MMSVQKAYRHDDTRVTAQLLDLFRKTELKLGDRIAMIVPDQTLRASVIQLAKEMSAQTIELGAEFSTEKIDQSIKNAEPALIVVQSLKELDIVAELRLDTVKRIVVLEEKEGDAEDAAFYKALFSPIVSNAELVVLPKEPMRLGNVSGA